MGQARAFHHRGGPHEEAVFSTLSCLSLNLKDSLGGVGRDRRQGSSSTEALLRTGRPVTTNPSLYAGWATLCSSDSPYPQL